jgi:hypothetical protein
MENEYNNEPVVTLKDVLEFIASTAILICLVVIAFAIIWRNWYVVQVSLTIIVADLAICGFCWWLEDKFKKFTK